MVKKKNTPVASEVLDVLVQIHQVQNKPKPRNVANVCNSKSNLQKQLTFPWRNTFSKQAIETNTAITTIRNALMNLTLHNNRIK